MFHCRMIMRVESRELGRSERLQGLCLVKRLPDSHSRLL
ncbi:hypothetical protein EVA_11179 [gut metagenome]|uniref:Uncharacterized protein n=1 Tax=gut metagenome TaxID=749906 RepID=J9G1J2_9ZZZZ